MPYGMHHINSNNTMVHHVVSLNMSMQQQQHQQAQRHR
jgi:hypothetical protein